MNDRTNASQWDFPTEEDNSEDLKGSQTQTSSQGDTKTSSVCAVGATGQSLSTFAVTLTNLLMVQCVRNVPESV